MEMLSRGALKTVFNRIRIGMTSLEGVGVEIRESWVDEFTTLNEMADDEFSASEKKGEGLEIFGKDECGVPLGETEGDGSRRQKGALNLLHLYGNQFRIH